MATTAKLENLDFNKVWLMFQETDRQLQATKEILDSKFQETDRQFMETKKQLQATKEILDSKFQETDRQFKEMIAEQKRIDKKSRDLEHLFTSKWGELIETLVEGKLVELLNQRGIPVNQTTRRYEVKYKNKDYEFDIIAIDGTDAVIVEVKTTLSVKYVKDFVDKMQIIKEILPIYRPFNVIGALAYLNHHEQAEKYAQGKGLLTIRATGESAFITNSEDFKPKSW